MEITEWLPGWSLCINKELTLPYVLNPHACGMIREAGATLFRLGALPSYSERSIEKFARLGTSGNFAVRNNNTEVSFMVTRRDAHKGRLVLADFSCILSIDWRKKKLFCYSAPGMQPSTDSLLIAKTFTLNDTINAWAHFHIPVDTPYAITLTYPALQQKDWDTMRTVIKKGARAINMIDHDLMRKNGIADGTTDAAIIIGEDPKETFIHAISLVQDAIRTTEH